MKGYSNETYGDGAQKTGLMLALVDAATRQPIDWPTYPPLGPDEIEWPKGYAEHYGVHQFDVDRTDLTTTEKAA